MVDLSDEEGLRLRLRLRQRLLYDNTNNISNKRTFPFGYMFHVGGSHIESAIGKGKDSI